MWAGLILCTHALCGNLEGNLDSNMILRKIEKKNNNIKYTNYS